MTETEWFAASDPKAMLESLRDRASDRKVRLFSCGCCRLVWEQLEFDSQRAAVEVAERFADGIATADEVREARKVAEKDYFSTPHSDAGYACRIAIRCVLDRSRRRGVSVAQSHLQAAVACAEYISTLSIGSDKQTLFLREIFGNPFRPVSIQPTWLTSDVVALASGIYQERAFDRMPILADALQDAGCDNAEVLAHCRSPGPHVRGCHVLDLILGKS